MRYGYRPQRNFTQMDQRTKEIPYTLIGLILEGISYGVYGVIFCLYLRIQFKRIDRRKSLLVYAVIANFILCTAYLALDSTTALLHMKLTARFSSQSILEARSPSLWFSVRCLFAAVDTLYICIDFMSQAILIYRCWMMWRRPLIVVIPILLSLAFLANSLITLIFLIRSPGFCTAWTIEIPSWSSSVIVSFFSISLAVNALVTGLIVFKILKIHRDSQVSENPNRTTRTAYTYGEGPHDLHLIATSILVESGMITFVGQLLQVILYKVNTIAFPLVSGIVVMLYGISTKIVLVRVQIRVSYDNETPRIASSRPMHFAPFHSESDSNNQVVQITRSNPNSRI